MIINFSEKHDTNIRIKKVGSYTSCLLYNLFKDLI